MALQQNPARIQTKYILSISSNQIIKCKSLTSDGGIFIGELRTKDLMENTIKLK